MAIDMEKVCVVADASDDMLVPDLGQHGPAESSHTLCFQVISSLVGHGISPSSAVLARLDMRACLGPGLASIKAQQAPLRLGSEGDDSQAAAYLGSAGPIIS